MKIIIVEDEFAIAMNTELQLKSKGFTVIGIASNFPETVELILEDTPDVILMDINLEAGGNGIEIATKLKKIIQVPIVFLSAYSDDNTVSKALQSEPYGYLVKPYKIEDLVVAIKLAYNNWTNRLDKMDELKMNDEESIFVQSGSKLIKTNLNDILFLQALDNYTIIQTIKNKIIVSDYLTSISLKINATSIVQTHRSYYVNTKHIDMVQGNYVFIGDFQIPISRSNKQEFLDKLNLLS